MIGTPPSSHHPHHLVFDDKTSFKLRHKTQMTCLTFIPALTATFVHISFSFTPLASRSESRTTPTDIEPPPHGHGALRAVSFRFPEDFFSALETARSMLLPICSFEQVGGKLERIEFETGGVAEDNATVRYMLMWTLWSVYHNPISYLWETLKS